MTTKIPNRATTNEIYLEVVNWTQVMWLHEDFVMQKIDNIMDKFQIDDEYNPFCARLYKLKKELKMAEPEEAANDKTAN